MAICQGKDRLGQPDSAMKIHANVLGMEQQRLLSRLGPLLAAWDYYLAGGTALALHLGHRRSLDLDWFTSRSVGDPLRLAQRLREEKLPFRTKQTARGTLHGMIAGVRVSLLEYRYRLLRPLLDAPKFGCVLASLEDLAAMKLAALAQRGAKKDFVDLYALGRMGIPLQKMLACYQQKYALQDIAHVLYSLVYFEDADRERMPVMLSRGNWRSIKKTIREWVLAVSG
jgi:hypothetical protein